MATSIAAVGLSKTIGDAVIVDDVSFEIAPRQLFFLLGPSGCGKTTTLRMLAGLSEPTAGSIRFGDRDVTHLPPRKRNIGMVFQNFALWPHMTVAENVEFGLRTRGLAITERRPRVSTILEEVGLAELAERRPAQLSGGQQQRVALARALVVQPDVLLLDEPLSNLDANLRVQLRELIRDLCQRNGVTTLYVTHDQEEAMSLADELAVMRDGTLLQVGSPETVYTRPTSAFVARFLGETNLRPAVVRQHDHDAVVVDTPLGTLLSRAATATFSPGSAVTCSIRPEALRLHGDGDERRGDAPNVIRGRLVRSERLGRWHRHTIRVAESTEITAHQPVTSRRWPEEIGLAVDPEDVVLLTKEPSPDSAAPAGALA